MERILNGSKKLSVIIPVYNSEKYLVSCIESVLCQNYANIEVLLIDNGSSDHSRLICEEYEKKDVRVHVYSELKSGAAAARNCGISHATGQYITFIDSDDYIDKDMYCELMGMIKQYSADIAICSFHYVNESGNSMDWLEPELAKYIKTKTDPVIDSRECASYFLTSRDIEGFCWNKVFKKSIIDDNDLTFEESKMAYEDMLFVFESVLKSSKIVLCAKKLYYYRQISNSLTRDTSSVRSEEFIDSINKIADVACSYDLGEAADNYRVARTICLAYNQMKAGTANIVSPLPEDISLFKAICTIVKKQRTEKVKTMIKLIYCLLFC